MARGIKPEIKSSSVADAMRDGDWHAVRMAMAIKLADAFDSTDSARDLKALSLSLIQLVEMCEMDAMAEGSVQSSPIFKIVDRANSA